MFIKPSPQSPPMFESEFIDRFSRTHAALVPTIYIPVSLGLLYWSVVKAQVSLVVSLLLFAGGWLAWTLTEYWAHRKFFHWVPNNAFGRRMHFIVHGVHHEWPNDKYRLVMPLAVSGALFFIFLAFFVGVFGRYGWGLLSGFAVGYMFYDTVHYYVHHFAPQTPWLKKLRKHHMVHHFKKMQHERKFGVSTTLWDHVFGTF